MAKLSSTSFVLAIALLFATISTSSATKIKPVCYTKIQKCCFKFAACGTIIKKVKKVVDCSFKKCFKVCKPKCIIVKKKVPRKVCSKVPKKTRVCKRVKVHHNFKYVWKTVCKKVIVFKTVCVKKYRIVKEKVCKKKCIKVCKKIKATCVKIHVFAFPKFCPTLKCYKFFFKGSTKKPAVVIGKKSKLIKIVAGKRTIKK